MEDWNDVPSIDVLH